MMFDLFFFFNDTATTEIYTLSLHDALPIFDPPPPHLHRHPHLPGGERGEDHLRNRSLEDRKSTRLNSSHANISYAVFCLKKKKNTYHASNHLNIVCRPVLHYHFT